jgi:hypothetical protein
MPYLANWLVSASSTWVASDSRNHLQMTSHGIVGIVNTWQEKINGPTLGARDDNCLVYFFVLVYGGTCKVCTCCIVIMRMSSTEDILR